MSATVTISVGRHANGKPAPLLCIRSRQGETVLMAGLDYHGKKLMVWSPLSFIIGPAASNQRQALEPMIKNGRKVLSALMGWSKP